MTTKVETLDARTLRFCALSCRRKANERRAALKLAQNDREKTLHDMASMAFEQAADQFLTLAQQRDGKGRQ